MQPATRRQLASLIGILFSVGLFFTVGFWVEMFGSEIDIKNEAYKLSPFLFLITGFYSIGYETSHKQGLKMVAYLIGMFLMAIVFGYLLGNY